ncbi:hypothetical protein ACVNF4_27190 [Streptomyces sp. S6]
MRSSNSVPDGGSSDGDTGGAGDPLRGRVRSDGADDGFAAGTALTGHAQVGQGNRELHGRS